MRRSKLCLFLFSSLFPLFFSILACALAHAEDGYRLWLRYDPVSDVKLRDAYRTQLTELIVPGESATLEALRKELTDGLGGLLDRPIPFAKTATTPTRDGALLVGTPKSCPLLAKLDLGAKLKELGPEGYIIRSAKLDGVSVTVIASQGEVGALYGSFHLLRLLQTNRPIDDLNVAEKPALERRLLNHWDNPDGGGDRMYSGRSIWKWKELPEKIDPRYTDYARANASIGINGMVVNNVNTRPVSFKRAYLEKTAALANVLRPYGIRVYLSARFSAPIELGGLKTADPLDPQVQAWWKAKTDEIYRLIPDFGGYLIKADSEGQPGPKDYRRNHAEGANMLADALAPHGGILMWRAFVYDENVDPDRIKRAHKDFVPLDGKFRSNVFVQVKNGALDFQPREPFHSLFGAMPKTPLMPELQITQEYLGHSTYLVYLAPMWKEFLDADTYASAAGSTVAKIVDGSLSKYALTGMAGVANVGDDRNWCGHHFGQANWFAYGRLAWDHGLTSEQIADEWVRMTWTNDPKTVAAISKMMLGSWETSVNYMMPLGLAILHRGRGHYEPEPQSRGDFHRGDAKGLGYDRTTQGSDGVSQYHSPLRERWNDLNTCDEKFLCWFHHVPWDHRMQSGRTFLEELQHRYELGVKGVSEMQAVWKEVGASGKIDRERFDAVNQKLEKQFEHAQVWKKTCLDYFGQLAGQQKNNADKQ